MLQKMIWAGANQSSYEMAAEAMQKLAERPISARRIRRQRIRRQRIRRQRIRRQVEAIGEARIIERTHNIESLKAMTIKERRTGSPANSAPQLAVVMMDGGRYQRRDRFGKKRLP